MDRIILNNINVNYKYIDNELEDTIVFLHGWGQNIEMMDPIGRGLQKDFHITILDLPGFGKSAEPSYGYTIYDYYETFKEFLAKLKIKNTILIGHSFGGRISIIYSPTI